MNNTSQGTQPESLTKRRVRINEVPTEIISQKRHKVDPGYTWYSKSERKRIARQNNETVCAYKTAQSKSLSFEEDERLCLRGLEERLSTGAMVSRKSQKFHYIRGVLREQARRRREGILEGTVMVVEPDIIATSKWATKNALEMAKRDNMDAYNESTEIAVSPSAETGFEEACTPLDRDDRRRVTLMPPCC